ncbi:MAG: hypothetical protein AAFQ91_13005 [Cyanobacteria bacterium J06621_15]
MESNKILVSLNLNIPLEFEIELKIPESREFNGQENLNSVLSSRSDLIIKKISEAASDEKIEDISNQLMTQIVDNYNQQENLSTQMTEKMPNVSLNCENNQKISNSKKAIKKRLADSLNDSLTFGVNIFGTVLFLGKLANYSWE